MSDIPQVLLGDNIPGRQIQNLNLKKEALTRTVLDLQKEQEKLKKDKEKIDKKEKEEEIHYEGILSFFQEKLSDLKEKQTVIEYEYQMLIGQNNDQEDDLRKELDEDRKSYEAELQSLIEKLKKFDQRQQQVDQYLNDKKELQQAIENLKIDVQNEKSLRKRVVADVEKEKLLQRNNLEEEMGGKMDQTRNQLLSLKREQVQTTTKLTIMQNYQLAQQLEQQSKNTEKMLAKNKKLTETMKKLKKDVEIYKDIAQELQVQSRDTQKHIKMMQSQIEDLEKNNMTLQEERDEIIQPQFIEKDYQNKKAEVLDKLEQDLQVIEKSKAKILKDIEIIKTEQFNIQKIIDTKDHKNQNLSNLMVHTLDNFIQNRIGIYDESNLKNSQIDTEALEYIRQIHPDEWNQEDKDIIITYLLNKLKSALTKDLLMNDTADQEDMQIEILPEESFQHYQDDTQSHTSSQMYNSDNQNAISTKQSSIILPKISNEYIQNSDIYQEPDENPYNRFKGLPVNISAQILKGDVREWGQKAKNIPSKPTKAMRERRLKML